MINIQCYSIQEEDVCQINDITGQKKLIPKSILKGEYKP